MFLLFGVLAMLTAVCNLWLSFRGKNAQKFCYLSLSFTALTVCALYGMDAQFVAKADWAALMDVVPSMSKLCWIGTVVSVVINGATLFVLW